MAMVQYTDHDHSAKAKCQIGLISVSVGSGKKTLQVAGFLQKCCTPTIRQSNGLPFWTNPSNIFDGQGNPRPAVENEMFEK